MEKAGQIASGANFGVLKEPRGIMKPIQWVLSIFAFATMTSPHLLVKFSIFCKDSVTNKTTTLAYQLDTKYPYSLRDTSLSTNQLCNNGSIESSTALLGGDSGSAQFYVFVGVMVFLYCLAALILYIFFDTTYRKHNAFTIGDFVASGVIMVLWLISSSAWAQGVTDLKYYTDLQECGYLAQLQGCKVAGAGCQQTAMANFASLNISIIFGFLNMCVWAGNMWFLYKETPWHHIRNQPSEPQPQPGFEPGQQRI